MKVIYALTVGMFLLVGLIISHGAVPPVVPPVDPSVVTTLDPTTCFCSVLVPPEVADARLVFKEKDAPSNTPASDPDLETKAKQDGCVACASQ